MIRHIYRRSQPVNEVPVYRTTDLPTGHLRGLYFVTDSVVHATQDALMSFAVGGIADRGHEGIAYWAGREFEGTTVFLQAVIPNAETGPGRVSVSGPEIGRTQRAARKHRLGILAQVHSHPSNDARHSDGDDELVLMPFEGMLSIVVPHFGMWFRDISDTCVHQYQDGRWVLCTPESVSTSFRCTPSGTDLRVQSDE
jgi:proteasome lid subunit RPN8/RPN11